MSTQTSIDNYFSIKKRGLGYQLQAKRKKRNEVLTTKLSNSVVASKERCCEPTENTTLKRILDESDCSPPVFKHVKKLRFGGETQEAEEVCVENIIQGSTNESVKPKLEEISDNTSSKKDRLSPQELRDRLKQCGGLEQLKICLSKINKCSKELKDLKEKNKPVKKLQKFQNVDIDIPQSPSKLASPIKSPAKSPAYQKYYALSSAVPSTLVLPYKYKFLLEVFRCCDTVVSMMYNRKEQITYSKLKSSVERMLRRNFSELYLSQIVTVYPSAYSFSWEKVKFRLSPEKSYQLIITPILEDSSGALNSDMNSQVLLKRKNYFHHSLLTILKNIHSEYLKNVAPGMAIPEDSIVRWHPSFLSEDIPDIESTPLPKPQHELHYKSAADILEQTAKFTEINPRFVEAIKKVADNTTSTEDIRSNCSTVPNALKGVSQKLLEKIREKESLKAKQEMMRDPVRDSELAKIKRLPELARIARGIFVAERKTALLVSQLCKKLSESFKQPLSIYEAEEHVLLLLKHVPEFGKIHTLQKGKFLRIDKEFDVNTAIRRLDKVQ